MASNPLFIHDNADKTPPIPSRPPHAMISGSDWRQPPRARLDWPWHVSLALGVVLLLFGGFLVYRIDGALRAWSESSPLAAWISAFAPAALVGVGLCVGVYWLAGKAYYSIARSRALAYQELLTRTRLGVPVRADAVGGWQQAALAEQQAIAMQIQIAPHTKYPLLSTLSEGNHEEATTTINGLADTEQSPGGVPSADWLKWIDATPHLMIAGRTNAGKTTLASAILAERIQAGDEILVIDPHDQPDKWFGVQAIGGGRQYGEILAMLDQVVGEMDARYQAYNEGTPTSAFTRLTVLVDEVPAIMDACLNEKRRIIDARWSNFARQLGSEARKVRISVVLLTQSALVQDIGVNTAMRKNFSRIALGDETRQLLSEVTSSERRKTLEELIRGQSHPAVMEYKSEIHVLNTGDVPILAQQDVQQLVRVWQPLCSALPTQHQNGGDPGRSTQSRAQSIRFTDIQRDDWVRVMLRDGRTWRDIRARLTAAGLTIDNNRLSELSRAEQIRL